MASRLGLRRRLRNRLWALLQTRTPPPVQRLASGALDVLARRWPVLRDLLGSAQPDTPRAADTPAAGVPAPPPPVVTPAPSPDELPGARNVQVLMAELSRNEDWQQRAEAARELGRHVHATTTRALCEGLRDPTVEVAVACSEALAQHGGDAAREALLHVVDSDGGYFSPLVRAACVRAVGQLKDPRDGERLRAAMRHVDAEVSVAAIASVAERDGNDSGDALLSLLGDDSRFFLPITRLSAARALCRLPAPDPQRVAALLENEADPGVRAELERLAASPGR